MFFHALCDFFPFAPTQFCESPESGHHIEPENPLWMANLHHTGWQRTAMVALNPFWLR
jgi:hypothetical protein